MAVEEAHRHNLPVTAHAHGLPAVEQVVGAGAGGIEHCTCLTPSGIQQPERLLAALAARQTAACLTPGWAPGTGPPPAVAALMAKAGVRLVLGSDAGIGVPSRTGSSQRRS